MNNRRVTLPLVAVCISTMFFGACALARSPEPVSVRLPDALSGTWETTESSEGNVEVWILREDGDLSVLEIVERAGEMRERESWNGSWWTQPSGNGGREICYVARHGRNAWCEEYTLTTEPALLKFGDQEFRPRSAR